MPVIEARGLVKRYKALTAVDGVDLAVEAGECFGLLGPNGAGKTTLIRMLTATSPPDGGSITILGMDLAAHSREVKARLGLVPQLDNLDPDLPALKNLTVFARYFDIPHAEAQKRSLAALDFFALTPRAKSCIKELSGGMKRRLMIARGLLNNPEILILDEPTVGLDPQSRLLLWQKLNELKARGVTLLLCTQNMEEAAYLCGRVAIMHQGRIIALDAPAGLVKAYGAANLEEVFLKLTGRGLNE